MKKDFVILISPGFDHGATMLLARQLAKIDHHVLVVESASGIYPISPIRDKIIDEVKIITKLASAKYDEPKNAKPWSKGERHKRKF